MSFVMKDSSHPDRSLKKAWPSPQPDLQAAIGRRAEEIYIRNGRIPGRDLENWVQAEAEILRESAQDPAKRARILVKVDGVQYVGEYDASATGYTPGEFATGDPLPIRFEGDKMFIRRRDQTELETTIVKKSS
jgi:hypothetical protein